MVHLTPKSSFILINTARHRSESMHVWAFSALRSHPYLCNSRYVHQVLLAKAKSPPKADQALEPSAHILSSFHTEGHPSVLSQPAPSPHPNLTATALTCQPHSPQHFLWLTPAPGLLEVGILTAYSTSLYLWQISPWWRGTLVVSLVILPTSPKSSAALTKPITTPDKQCSKALHACCFPPMACCLQSKCLEIELLGQQL